MSLGIERAPMRCDQGLLHLLNEVVLPSLFAEKNRTSVRAWVPNVGTGESAHWLTILLIEYIERHGLTCDVRVFGSESDETPLPSARSAIYPRSIEQTISPEQLRRFYHAHPAGYQLTKRVRDCLLFSNNDLRRDPPFARLDLVLAENAFRDFAPEHSLDVIRMFHYALVPSGYLLLGGHPAPRGASEFFTPVADDCSVFRARADRTPLLPLVSQLAVRRSHWGGWYAAPSAEPRNVRELGERLVLDNYSPPCVVVDERGKIVDSTGNVGRYLENPAGAPTHDFVAMTRPELRGVVAALLQKTCVDARDCSAEVNVSLDGSPCRLSVNAHRLDYAAQALRAFVFVEMPLGALAGSSGPYLLSTDRASVERIRDELQMIRSEFQSSSEELRTSMEELRSLNEELESANQELELTSDELKNMNLSLADTNEGLKGNVIELEAQNREFSRLLANAPLALLYLDQELRIVAFTPPIRDLYKIITADCGRPLRDIAQQFKHENVEVEVREVMRSGSMRELHVISASNRWYQLRIAPYWNGPRTNGVVLSFTDITELKRSELEVLSLRAKLSTQNRWLRAHNREETSSDPAPPQRASDDGQASETLRKADDAYDDDRALREADARGPASSR